uniref:Uncharacterized protein n=1 Tax=Sus scrofa TaxID=9823 RepID=A0A4X1TRP0_PIG
MAGATGQGPRWAPIISPPGTHTFVRYRSGFLNLDTADMIGCVILCCRGCTVHCRMFSSIPGLPSLDASIVTSQSVSRHCQMSPGGRGLGQSPSWLTTICL